jgi:molybdate transport system substrate-binding protein
MRKKICIIVILIIIAIFFIGCTSKNKGAEINISAAASLMEALEEIKTEYEKFSDSKVYLNFASSGALKKQIQEGAPCDIFISASKDHMKDLIKEGHIIKNSEIDLLVNTLTLIASKEKAHEVSLENLSSDMIESISIATPDSAPVGKYSKQALEKLEIWDKITEKLVYAKDVKQVLEYVDSGNADCGFVYHSDAITLKESVIIERIDKNLHDPIVYPVGVVDESKNKEAAEDFLEFLNGENIKGIFSKYGFEVID